jgi:DNA-binding NarL/FixJ family response regulator
VDIVLLDFDMPQMDGISGVSRMRELFPLTRIAIISGTGVGQQIREALVQGACSSYLPKTLPGDMLLAAVRLILSGATYILPDTLLQNRHAVSERPATPCQTGRHLSARELEVLRLFADGMGNKVIARALGIAEVTVKLHVRHVLRKLNVRNRAEAAAVAISRALVQPE